MLPALPESALAARRLATRTFRAWDIPADVADPAILLVSELVTNAVRHAGSQVELVLERWADTLRASVSDTVRTMPQVRRAGPTDEGGRGLALVEALSARWGVVERKAGKQVWFEFRL
ncbi:MAG: ATP-binding protein [Actinomycetota bacterium]|nr:ATP-binding protein [Actinomycetota bacterium]